MRVSEAGFCYVCLSQYQLVRQGCDLFCLIAFGGVTFYCLIDPLSYFCEAATVLRGNVKVTSSMRNGRLSLYPSTVDLIVSVPIAPVPGGIHSVCSQKLLAMPQLIRIGGSHVDHVMLSSYDNKGIFGALVCRSTAHHTIISGSRRLYNLPNAITMYSDSRLHEITLANSTRNTPTIVVACS